jgi:hypothetical protein
MKRGVFGRLKLLITQPHKLFQEVRRETSIVGGFEVFFLSSVLILSFQVLFLIFAPLFGKLLKFPDIEFYLILNAGLVIVSLIILFISSFAVHFFIKLYKGKQSYAATFNVLVYSLIPYIILSIIPIIGSLAIFYTLFLMVVGFMEVHKLRLYKAILSALLFIWTFVILFLLFLMSVITYLV